MEEQTPFIYRGFRRDWAKNLHVWNLKIHKISLASVKMQRKVYAPWQGKAFVKVMQGLLSALRALYGGTT